MTLRGLVEAEQRRAGVPGCAVAVVDNGVVVLNEGFGHRDVETAMPVTTQTLFPIGSATKTFTAALLASFADDGRLDFDVPIRKYRPGFAMHDPIATEHMSLRDCLSHRSGLPRHDVLWQAGDGRLSRDDVIRALAHLPASKPFRADYQYNNLLYIAAGELAAGLAGGPYEEAVTNRILQPLGMSRTNFSVAATEQDGDHATPYLRPAGQTHATGVPFASVNLAGPAGGLNSCADDLVPWLLTLTGYGAGSRPPLLSATVLDELRTPAIALPEEPVCGVTPVGYGLGLMLEDYRGHRISHHGGNIDGFSSEVLTRDDGIGIAVLCNLHATWLRDSLPYLILDALDEVPSPDHGSGFRDRLAAKFAAADAARAQFPLSVTKHSPAGAKPSRPLTDYRGAFRHPAYGECVVGRCDGGLTWEYGGLPSAALVHRRDEQFEIVTTLNGSEARFAAEFAVTTDVDAVLVQLETAVPPIRFHRVA